MKDRLHDNTAAERARQHEHTAECEDRPGHIVADLRRRITALEAIAVSLAAPTLRVR